MSTYRCTVTCQYLGRLWSPGELLESEAVPPVHFAPIEVPVQEQEQEQEQAEAPTQGTVQEAEPEKRGRIAAKK